MKTRAQTKFDSEWIAYAERIVADLEAPFKPPATVDLSAYSEHEISVRVSRGEGPDALLQPDVFLMAAPYRACTRSRSCSAPVFPRAGKPLTLNQESVIPMSTTKKIPIKALKNFRRLAPEAVFNTSVNVYNETYNNPNFTPPQAPAPPVDAATLKAANDTLGAANAAAADGGKKAVAQRNKAKEAVVKLLVQLAHFVEANCKDDMTIFLSSGFTAAASTKSKKPPVSEAIRKLEPGANSGQMQIILVKFPGAISHEVHYGVPAQGGGLPTTWTTVPIPQVKSPTTISGLTPATIYVFQARAMTKNGYTDWSDPIARVAV